MLAYDVVIPTRNRAESLRMTLASILAQEVSARTITVIDASDYDDSERICTEAKVNHHRAEGTPSAARQRNQGAALGTSPIVLFCDDDITLAADTTGKLLTAYHEQGTGGVAARIDGCELPPPSRLTRAYYRIQAGYDDPHFGARLLGPAITTYPCYQLQGDGLIAAEWLNSGLVSYRREAFEAYRFPEFDGYSAFEDVHLSASIAKNWKLYFDGSTDCQHGDNAQSMSGDQHRSNTAMHFRNLPLVARSVLGMPEPELTLRVLLHRLFVTAAVLKARPTHALETLAGIWTLKK